MSLGDLGKNIRASSGDFYARQRGRIMREAEAHKKMIETREIDRLLHEISSKRIERQRLTGDIQRIEREIQMAHLKYKDDKEYRRVVEEKNRRIKALELDRKKLENDERRAEMDIKRFENRAHLH